MKGIPYLDLLLLRPVEGGDKSNFPRIRRYLTPGKSGVLPPLTKTKECSCKVWDPPGI